MHANLHFFRVKGLSLAGQENLLEIVCTHGDIHGSFTNFYTYHLWVDRNFLKWGEGDSRKK